MLRLSWPALFACVTASSLQLIHGVEHVCSNLGSPRFDADHLRSALKQVIPPDNHSDDEFDALIHRVVAWIDLDRFPAFIPPSAYEEIVSVDPPPLPLTDPQPSEEEPSDEAALATADLTPPKEDDDAPVAVSEAVVNESPAKLSEDEIFSPHHDPALSHALTLQWTSSLEEATSTLAQVREAQTAVRERQSTAEGNARRKRQLRRLQSRLEERERRVTVFIEETMRHAELRERVRQAGRTADELIAKARRGEAMMTADVARIMEKISSCQEVLVSIGSATAEVDFAQVAANAADFVRGFMHFRAFRAETMSGRFFLPFGPLFGVIQAVIGETQSFEAMVYREGACDEGRLAAMEGGVEDAVTLLEAHNTTVEEAKDDLYMTRMQTMLWIRKFALANIRRVLLPAVDRPTIEFWADELMAVATQVDNLVGRRSSGAPIQRADVVKLRFRLLFAHINLADIPVDTRSQVSLIVHDLVKDSITVADRLGRITQDALGQELRDLIEEAAGRIVDKEQTRKVLAESSNLSMTVQSIEHNLARMRLLALYSASLPTEERSHFFCVMTIARENARLANVTLNIKLAQMQN